MSLLTLLNQGHRLGAENAPVVVEAYLDYVCPFSAKFFKTFTERVFPYVQNTYPDQVQFIFRHQVQPWHPQSSILHEAALAVEAVDPDQFFPFSAALFDRQANFFDAAVHHQSRHELNTALAQYAHEVTGLKSDQVVKQLNVATSTEEGGAPQNIGNKVTNDLKLHIKLGRQQGIHVSPTFLYNGLVDNNVSSSWTLEQWTTYFDPKLATLNTTTS
ncbi:hypothetical protein H4R33_002304 [Dimargaris cristalligena]|uniref:Thioredoxin-like protein n=1 Tax=Dimargaris cristalligena TaxID=215637 RepID=A0A4P9ZXS9_9FUNG|nr:hypothetical protein H4R33_002304 [Dimargaris cristalligena]RKP38525.1 thioredoxin-like protein [Dimargaris cristalligena]|eukprot:RKP38525.1 thioredoxin-like protein [Dimargaris cristalligena]